MFWRYKHTYGFMSNKSWELCLFEQINGGAEKDKYKKNKIYISIIEARTWNVKKYNNTACDILLVQWTFSVDLKKRIYGSYQNSKQGLNKSVWKENETGWVRKIVKEV